MVPFHRSCNYWMRFFTNAYDLFCITPVTILLDRIYFYKVGVYSLSNNVVAAVIGVALCGTLAGQLFFASPVTKWAENSEHMRISCVQYFQGAEKLVTRASHGMATIANPGGGRHSSYTLGSLPDNVVAAVNGVALCGTLVSQLFFGWLGDKMGQKLAYGMTLMLMVICSIAFGFSFGKDPEAVMATLCFFRF
ncbi:hypothetical protein JRO89_XS11G0072300 [Xanthoceras sorbifolium]|uniref:Major facilitator superfamily (MFS) profile domain-containing protein n=1 Tax=Xanthoceras sorbifolium TaxID=99658 RepID=A0ABQ8HEY8_9ROSI|nr:hypothetical protein JRO89_XS11G0072300 [Xanthoceras sorbifolium]